MNVQNLFFQTSSNTLNIVILITCFLCLAITVFSSVRQKHFRFLIKFIRFFRHGDNTKSEYLNFISSFAYTLSVLSARKVGALIVMERKNTLESYIKIGLPLETKFSSDFVTNVFSNKESALHDGGIVMRGVNIIAISTYFPITKTKLDSSFGARHRAAIGITEDTDCIAFIVSESSGNISFSKSGQVTLVKAVNLQRLTQNVFDLLSLEK